MKQTTKKLHIGIWFKNKKSAKQYAKKFIGRKVIYETDTGYFVFGVEVSPVDNSLA